MPIVLPSHCNTRKVPPSPSDFQTLPESHIQTEKGLGWGGETKAVCGHVQFVFCSDFHLSDERTSMSPIALPPVNQGSADVSSQTLLLLSRVTSTCRPYLPSYHATQFLQSRNISHSLPPKKESCISFLLLSSPHPQTLPSCRRKGWLTPIFLCFISPSSLGSTSQLGFTLSLHLITLDRPLRLSTLQPLAWSDAPLRLCYQPSWWVVSSPGGLVYGGRQVWEYNCLGKRC